MSIRKDPPPLYRTGKLYNTWSYNKLKPNNLKFNHYKKYNIEYNQHSLKNTEMYRGDDDAVYFPPQPKSSLWKSLKMKLGM